MSQGIELKENSRMSSRNNSTKLKPMTDKALLSRVVLETCAILITSIPLIYLYIANSGDVEPFKRGFFCDDENLKHPYREEQISVGTCAFIWIVAVLMGVITVESVTNCVHDFPQWSEALRSRGAVRTLKIPRVIIEIYRILGYFAVGALFCTLTTGKLLFKYTQSFELDELIKSFA